MSTARLPVVEETARRIVERVLAAPPTLGTGRLVCVDGPAGAGKTTLAAALRRGFRDTLRAAPANPSPVRPLHMLHVMHMDNVYDGWAGLHVGMTTMAEQVVAPLAVGAPGHYRRYDWHAGAFAEERVVEPCRVLVVEGVGSGHDAYDDLVTCLVWVDTPPAVRLERGLARDDAGVRAHWRAWQAQEERMFATQRTRERADLQVDGVP